ncbi:MAG: ParB/RepB/Spo0J family partition protein [Clostridia bacterium]|nr:ParB/RepB/Spo0J family partition protein [Clostridia bacterium]
MTKKTGLGKGLDALFESTVIQENKKNDKLNEDKIYKIKVIDIEPNKNQPRRKFDSESLEELAESIKRYGIIQPILVIKKDNYYEIVAGERRWRAAKKAGLAEVPCIITSEDERKNKEIALIENIQREDLNPIEKARGFKLLIEEYNLTQQELANIIGLSRCTITNTLRILNLDSRVIDLVLDGKITESHCKSILSEPDGEKQYQLALRIIEKGQSVKSLEKNMKVKKELPKKDKRFMAVFQDIEDNFQSFFGTKVKLDPGKKKGKIIIEYNSNDDLERMLSLIK